MSLKNTENKNLSNFENNIVGPAPFHFEERAIEELNNCDYSIKITRDLAINGNSPRRIRIYTDGIYDLFHAGHARQFMQAKNMFPNTYLIVGACNDEVASKLKGKTVLNELERYESLRHCRYVDEIVIDAPLIINEEFLKNHKIDFVAQDPSPYPVENLDDVYELAKQKGIFLETLRTEGISTTDIITRIIKDYDGFVQRNLKKGCKPQDLNIRFFKDAKIQISDL